MKNLASYYDSISCNNLDLSKKYIYYCLHFDPEASTLPKDNAYFNQLLNLRILLSSIPSDWYVYVKEHPHQLQYKLYREAKLENHLHSVDNFRSKSFYNYINSYKNAQLVGFKTNHHSMIQKAQFIASNTGTVYRESSHYNKQCISFSSSSFYGLLNNVHPVKDVLSCKKIIDKYKGVAVKEDGIDSIFNTYSLMIKYKGNLGSNLLSFISRNKLFLKSNCTTIK